MRHQRLALRATVFNQSNWLRHFLIREPCGKEEADGAYSRTSPRDSSSYRFWCIDL